jgi:hypothetical protein
MVDRDPVTADSRSFLLRVTPRGRDASYLVYDLRTGESRRFTSALALQRFLAQLRRVPRLH